MLKYICKRIGLFIVSLFIIMTMLFVLIRMLPNPVVAVTGGYAKQLEDMRRAWGYLASINMRDYSVFLAISMFYVVIGLAAGILFDLSYGLIDPRIRMGGNKTNEL